MFWFKRCPRCGGDLYEHTDIWGRDVACLQCGHYLTHAEEVALRYTGKLQQRYTMRVWHSYPRLTLGWYGE